MPAKSRDTFTDVQVRRNKFRRYANDSSRDSEKPVIFSAYLEFGRSLFDSIFFFLRE